MCAEIVPRCFQSAELQTHTGRDDWFIVCCNLEYFITESLVEKVDVVKAAMYLDPKARNKAGSIIGSVQIRRLWLLPVFLWRSALSMVSAKPDRRDGLCSRGGLWCVSVGCPDYGNWVVGIRLTPEQGTKDWVISPTWGKAEAVPHLWHITPKGSVQQLSTSICHPSSAHPFVTSVAAWESFSAHKSVCPQGSGIPALGQRTSFPFRSCMARVKELPSIHPSLCHRHLLLSALPWPCPSFPEHGWVWALLIPSSLATTLGWLSSFPRSCILLRPASIRTALKASHITNQGGAQWIMTDFYRLFVARLSFSQ